MRRWPTLLALCCVVSACAGSRGTIGAVLGQSSEGRLVLREIPAGLAASRAQLRVGDEILTIDGVDVRAMSAEQVHRRLSGQVGDRVKLTLLRGEEVIRVTLTLTPAQRRRVAR